MRPRPACVSVVGGGLAGCEAALWLAGRGVKVTLYEQKPQSMSLAHKSPLLAELVCSNSLKAAAPDTAAGLLKAEMRLLGSSLLPVADACRVAAGGALAVDRAAFAAGVTALVERTPNIRLVRSEVTGFGPLLEQGPVIAATGPLTAGALAREIAGRCGGMLFFYDAAAPVVTAESLVQDRLFSQSRYGRHGADYLNCPLDRAQYEAFYAALLAAETAPPHACDAPGPEGEAAEPASVEAAPLKVYEGCMPIEQLARRGADTLRFGPMKPVGLCDPHTGRRPWACVQLRRENAGGTLYNLVGFQTNLRFGEQKRVFGMIPGLEKAEFARYGVQHRNSFLNSPAVLEPGLRLKGGDALFFAGQLTGTEGYMESAACGLLAARSVLLGKGFTAPPRESMCGALLSYLAAENRDFQPMGANMGLLPPPNTPERDRKKRYAALAARALAALQNWIESQHL